MPVYRSYLAMKSPVKKGLWIDSPVMNSYVAYRVEGYVNKVILQGLIEAPELSTYWGLRIWFNDKPIQYVIGSQTFGPYDVTELFKPRTSGEGANKFSCQAVWTAPLVPESVLITAWLDIDVSGTIVEVGSSKSIGYGFESIAEVIVNLMMLMMWMSLLMGVMSSFMGVFG